MRTVYLVPSRGRPANAARLAERWLLTTGYETHLIFFVDDDDPRQDEYAQVLDSFGTEQVTLMFDERRRVGPTLNHWAPKLAANYAAVGFMGDDHLPRDVGWDARLVEVLGKRPCTIAYGDDLFQRENLPTAVVMDSRIISTLGYMVPPGLTHLYLDNFWRDLGRALGTLVYCPQVVIEHMHPQAQKAEWDDGYVEVNGSDMWDHDREVYRLFTDGGDLTAAASKLKVGMR